MMTIGLILLFSGAIAAVAYWGFFSDTARERTKEAMNERVKRAAQRAAEKEANRITADEILDGIGSFCDFILGPVPIDHGNSSIKKATSKIAIDGSYKEGGYKCSSCGANLSVVDGLIKCEWCETFYTLSSDGLAKCGA